MPVNSLFLGLAAALTLSLFTFAQAGDVQVQVEDAWARRAALLKGGAGSGNSAVYAVLVNKSKVPDALVAADSDAAETVEIHESYLQSSMIIMRAVKKIEIAAGDSVELKPGGYHIMLLNLKHDLKVGETIGVTLRFEKAGKIPVTATVR